MSTPTTPAAEPRIESVLRKVRGLRALATSSNIHEAEAAAAQAEALIAKYRLEEAQIGVSDAAAPAESIEESGECLDRFVRDAAWRRSLRATLVRHYGCAGYMAWRFSPAEKRGAWEYVVIGRPSDVAALRYMLAWLTSEIARLSQAERGRAGRNAFCVGAVRGFGNALYVAQRETEETHTEAHGNSAAMVLASRSKEATAWRDQKHPDMKTQRTSAARVSDAGAYHRGKAAGERLHGRGGALPAGNSRLLGSGS